MPQALVSLGANLGDRQAALDRAVQALGSNTLSPNALKPDSLNSGSPNPGSLSPGSPGSESVRLLARTPWYQTAPVGGPLGQDPFLNGVVRLETSLSPVDLLRRLQAIENDAGRVRHVEWGPRPLDLDLLFYDDLVIDTPELTLPHPRAAFRRFVLDGAAAVAPEWRHPILDRSLADLLRHLRETPRYVALVGAGVGFRNQLAGEAAHVAGARLVEATDAPLPASVDQVDCDAELGDTAVCGGPSPHAPIEFVRGRAAAIKRSLALGDDWFVDDAWLPAEALELASRMPAERRAPFVAACQDIWRQLPPPRLIACVVTPGDAAGAGGSVRGGRHAAAVAVRVAAPWPQPLPPVVDLFVADRERALTELAAALDAAG